MGGSEPAFPGDSAGLQPVFLKLRGMNVNVLWSLPVVVFLCSDVGLQERFCRPQQVKR